MPIPLKIKLKIIFSLNNGYSNQQTVIVEKSKSETMLHIILKLLALLYFYKTSHQLILEPKFRYRGFKPDLVAFKQPEVPQEVNPEIDIWIECKEVKISKLQTLARYLSSSRICWFHLNHIMSRKLEGFTESMNVELIGVELNNKNQSLLERSLLTQSPVWSIEDYEHSHLTIATLNWRIDIRFHIINSHGSNKKKGKKGK
ncbi:MAG: hypothetical protein ACW97Z_15365 [Candidatus Hodarchaeales archaeon]